MANMMAAGIVLRLIRVRDQYFIHPDHKFMEYIDHTYNLFDSSSGKIRSVRTFSERLAEKKSQVLGGSFIHGVDGLAIIFESNISQIAHCNAASLDPLNTFRPTKNFVR